MISIVIPLKICIAKENEFLQHMHAQITSDHIFFLCFTILSYVARLISELNTEI